MSLGADALLLVALCSITSWLLHRRRRRHPQPVALPAHEEDSLQALRANAVVCQPAEPGHPAQDWVVVAALQPSRGAPIALLCRLDGGGVEQQALLLIPAQQALRTESDRQVWLLRPLPRPQRPVAPAVEPPRTLSHAGQVYTQHADWRGLVRSLASGPVSDAQDGRAVLYLGPDRQRLLWWQHADVDAWYMGHKWPLSALDILPAGT